MRQALDEEEWEAASEVQVIRGTGEPSRQYHHNSAARILRHFAPASREGWPSAANSPNERNH